MSETTGGGKFGGLWTVLGIVVLLAIFGLVYWLIPDGKRDKPVVQPVAGSGAMGSWNPQPRPAPQPLPQPVTTSAAPLPPQQAQPTAPGPRARPSGSIAFSNPEPPRARATPAAAKPSEPEDLKIAGMTARRAEMLPEPAFWLMPGQNIPCILATPLDNPSDGTPFIATVPNDVKGLTGDKVLLPAGSSIYGTVTSGLQRGERRVGAVMQVAYWPSRHGGSTPVISLASTAANAMGTAGLEGNAGSDFWSRFASVAAYALLDTTVQAGGALGANALNGALNSGNGGGVYVNMAPITNGARSLSSAEYDQQRQRAAPFNRPQGHACSVVVQHPLDFRSIKGAIQ